MDEIDEIDWIDEMDEYNDKDGAIEIEMDRMV